MIRYLSILFLAITAFAAPSFAEEKPDPRVTVESALDHAIMLFEKKDFAKYFQECIVKSDRDRLLNGMKIEDFVKPFMEPEKENQIKFTIDNWKAFRMKTPDYNVEKTEAKYPTLLKGGTNVNLVFEKHGELWLISVFKSVSSAPAPE